MKDQRKKEEEMPLLKDQNKELRQRLNKSERESTIDRVITLTPKGRKLLEHILIKDLGELSGHIRSMMMRIRKNILLRMK